MGFDPITLGIGAISSIGGAIAGGSDSETTTTSQVNIPGAGAQEQQLQGISAEQAALQRALADQYERGIGSAQGLQSQAQQNYMDILTGKAYQPTAFEQQRIGDLRQGMVDQSMVDVNRLLDERLAGLNASAAQRGVRGQALSQLQGDALRSAAEQLGSTSRAASMQANQQLLNQGYQRVASQSPFIQQGSTLADMMRQQAFQNRQVTQSPYLLQLLNNERLAAASKSSTETTPGSVGGAIGGAIGGFGSGVGIGSQLRSGRQATPQGAQYGASYDPYYGGLA